MANGLFATKNIGTPGEIQRLMQLEQEKRIRDAGAGFSNPLVRARAMAGQGMQEAISGMGAGLTGLLGGQERIRMDPRMQEAVKRDRIRSTLMQKYKDAESDGDVSYEDRMDIADYLEKNGFPIEAERARASARATELHPLKKDLIKAQSIKARKGKSVQHRSWTKDEKKTITNLLMKDKRFLAKYKERFPDDWTQGLGQGPNEENLDKVLLELSAINQTFGNRLGPGRALEAWRSGITPDVSDTPGTAGTPGKKGTGRVLKPTVTGQQISGGTGAGTATPPAPAAAAGTPTPASTPAPAPQITLGQAMQGQRPPQVGTGTPQVLQNIQATNRARQAAAPNYPMFAPQPSAVVPAAPIAAPSAGTIRPAVQGQSMAIPPATTATPPSAASVAPPAPAAAPPGTIRPATPGQSMAIPPKDTPDTPDAFTLPDQDRKVFARIESSGKPTAVNGKSIGLYQFKYETAKELMPGIKKKDLLKPDIQEELLDRYIQKNAKQLGTTDPYELYMAHQQGVRGYKELLNMRDVKIKDIRNPDRKRNVMKNRRPETKADKNATVGDFLDQWKSHYYKIREDL